MGIFICKVCQKEFKNILGLRSHSSLSHGISPETLYVEQILNGEYPKCACGCGDKPPFNTIKKGFYLYIQSHHNRVIGNNNFHKNPETKIKSSKTQSENWKKELYRKWWEEDSEETKMKIESIKDKLRNNKNRGNKISIKLKGIPKTEEHKIKVSKSQIERFKNNPQLKIDASERRIKWLRKKQKNKKTKLEKTFEDILKLLKIKNEYQYEFNNRLFDFYLNDFNVLVEVDGDFYHCNPEIFPIPTYEVQNLSLKNDKFKNELCKNHNIKLLRYWEKDINERPEWVISDIKDKLQLKTLL